MKAFVLHFCIVFNLIKRFKGFVINLFIYGGEICSSQFH